MGGNNTTVEESTGTNSEIQGNYEKYKKSGEFLDFFSLYFLFLAYRHRLDIEEMFGDLLNLAGKRKAKLIASCILLILSACFSVIPFFLIYLLLIELFRSFFQSSKCMVSCSSYPRLLHPHLHPSHLCLWPLSSSSLRDTLRCPAWTRGENDTITSWLLQW